MSLIKNLFDKVIQIQTKIIEKMDNKIQLDSEGKLPDNIAVSYSKQKTIGYSSAATQLVFKNDISIYKTLVNSNKTFTFNFNQLDSTENSYVFELWLYLENDSSSITFPSNLTWLNDQIPDMSQANNLYCIVIRVLPNYFIYDAQNKSGTSISSPLIIGNLAYKHAITLA